jgi:hypothetical protein
MEFIISLLFFINFHTLSFIWSVYITCRWTKLLDLLISSLDYILKILNISQFLLSHLLCFLSLNFQNSQIAWSGRSLFRFMQKIRKFWSFYPLLYLYNFIFIIFLLFISFFVSIFYWFCSIFLAFENALNLLLTLKNFLKNLLHARSFFFLFPKQFLLEKSLFWLLLIINFSWIFQFF